MITEATYLRKALRAYDNPQCVSVEEFQQDLDRFSYIKKIFNRYQDGSGPVNERLVLNHLVVLFNLFDTLAIDLAFFKIESSQWGILLPYLIYLNRLPENYMVNGNIPWTDIKVDQEVIKRLREL